MKKALSVGIPFPWTTVLLAFSASLCAGRYLWRSNAIVQYACKKRRMHLLV
jgi:hypothetical protein